MSKLPMFFLCVAIVWLSTLMLISVGRRSVHTTAQKTSDDSERSNRLKLISDDIAAFELAIEKATGPDGRPKAAPSSMATLEANARVLERRLQRCMQSHKVE